MYEKTAATSTQLALYDVGDAEVTGTAPEPLSAREAEVLRLLATGLSNNEIARALVIAVSTVNMHVKHLYSKLQVHNRVQAAARAQALGLT